MVSRNLWLILPALTPLILIYRALAVPILKQQANTDPKTGLWNAQYYVNALEMELSRAERYDRPLTVVMADIDLLRNINNAYGHLAGDAVLIGVAKILKENLREYDLVARFGGEEFAILMPETDPSDALPRVEEIRRIVAEHEYEAPTTHVKIRATMSFGLAGAQGNGQLAKELIHTADVAVYEAKVKGRNRSCIYSRERAVAFGILQ
jgi:diguanylate cyclase (GGDEF)-like protein